MKLADETYGQAWQMTITEGPDVNAEECGHWYSPNVVARMIEEEREACAKACEAELIGTGKSDHEADRAYDRALSDAAKAIRMRSNVEVRGEPASSASPAPLPGSAAGNSWKG